MNRRERRAAASKSGSLAGVRPRTPDALFERATRHLEAGQIPEAESCCRQALAIDAGHGDALNLMGVLSALAHQNDRAVEWFAHAIRQGPKLDYLKNLGAALHRLGRLEEALKAYDKALMFAPQDAEIWMNIGNALAQAGRDDEASLSFEHALGLDPRLRSASIGRGRALFKLARYEEALASLDDLVNHSEPDDAEIAHMRSTCMIRMRRFEEALPHVERALALNPDNADALNNLGAIHQARGRCEAALPCFDRALALRPDFIHAMNNKAFSLTELQQFDSAFAIYDRVAALDPDNAVMRWNTAMMHLMLGDFEKGWIGRAARWKVQSLALAGRTFTQPAWLGDGPIEGKTILLYSDEGLGDTIQYARYVPLLADQGARIILQVEPAVRPLLAGMPGVSQCLSTTELPEFDLHCALSDLPLAFGTRLETIPAEVPYICAPAPARVRAWEHRLGSHDRLRVGLVWSGNPAHQNDHNRSIALHVLAPLLDCGAQFISLQKGVRDSDRAFLAGRSGIVDLTEHLTDFTETAALVSCLDLVISVDTSVAHLVGALGRPLWILLPYTPDFRWLLNRDDSPWYPSARLFRQSKSREWPSVVEQVHTRLQEAVARWTSMKATRARAENLASEVL
jgi:tetratricopeptide (TPR) repeat protein